MTTETLTLYRPWHQRVLDLVAEKLAGRRRHRAAHRTPCGLPRHLLADVGIEAGAIDAREARERQSALAVRLHALGGF